MKKASLLWMDLEMTGLDPTRDRIIEVAVIATDWDFNEVAQYEQVIYQPPEVITGMDEWNQHHHSVSGLLKKIPHGKDEKEVEAEVLSLIDEYCSGELYLAGNSIHQDRRFIRAYWPKLESKLHYRMLDVSAWKVVMSHKFNEVFTKREQHRALDDIRGSIEELQQYMKRITS